MDLLAIIQGVIIAAFSALVGGFIHKTFFTDKAITSVPPEGMLDKDSFSYLNGKWESYYITNDPSIHSGPFWLHGESHLKISDGFYVEGKHRITDHPGNTFDFKYKGEIRSGRMFLLQTCVQDNSEFAFVVFPNLFHETRLTGVWIGLDWQRKLTVGPVIYSRSTMGIDEINESVLSEELPASLHIKQADKLIAK